MEYIRVATINDFSGENIKSFQIVGRKVGIVKREDGTYFATEIACKHQGFDLSKGEIEGTVATCSCHKWKYDLETGKCLNHLSEDLRKYDLYLEGKSIFISLLPKE